MVPSLLYSVRSSVIMRPDNTKPRHIEHPEFVSMKQKNIEGINNVRELIASGDLDMAYKRSIEIESKPIREMAFMLVASAKNEKM